MIRAQFVDRPARDAVVRLDLHDDTTVRVLNADFTFGAPTYDGEPGSFGVEYGYRAPALRLQVVNNRAAALTYLNALTVELLRAENWLLVQLDLASAPVWVHTYRGQPGELTLDNVGNDIWEIAVPLNADPFFWGEKVTIGPVTINNDPAAATNPCRYVFTDPIKGDAPAPLTVAITPSVSWADGMPMFTVARFDSTPPAPTVWQTGYFSAGVDTTTSSGDPTFSDTAKFVVSFATDPSMVQRLNGPAPATPAPGRYKVLARVARSDTDTVFAAQLVQVLGLGVENGNGVTAFLDRSAFTTSGYACLLDLGEFVFPFGGEGWEKRQLGTPNAPNIRLKMQRISGTGSAWIDYLILIPVNTVDMVNGGSRTLKSHFRNAEIRDIRQGIWDAEEERFRAMNYGVNVADDQPLLSGPFPIVEPGRGHAFYLHHMVGTNTPPFYASNNYDSIAATADVTFSYYPRYLNLRGD